MIKIKIWGWNLVFNFLVILPYTKRLEKKIVFALDRWLFWSSSPTRKYKIMDCQTCTYCPYTVCMAYNSKRCKIPPWAMTLDGKCCAYKKSFWKVFKEWWRILILDIKDTINLYMPPDPRG